MKRISIILPVYNEEEGLCVFHRELAGVLDSAAGRYCFSVIYVLDRSKDNSLGVLKALASCDPRVTVLHLSRRFGHQMSLVAGMDHSDGDAAIMMDCDLQHPPQLIPKLLEKYEEGYDVVQTIRTYDTKTGILKRRTSSLFYRLQNLLSPVAIPEGAADFRLVSAKVIRLFQESIREQNQFLRGLFSWVGFRCASVPFVSPPRLAGETKYRILPLLKFSIAGITSFSKVPLRLGSMLGIVISLLSLIYGVVIMIDYFVSGTFPPGYASLFVGLLFIGGLQLIVLGVIGEYMGGIFDEVKRRPLYIVDEVIRGPQE